MKNYFIKENYKPNRSNSKLNEFYWNDDRISRTHIYPQYHVYKFCQKLVKNNEIRLVLDIGCGKGEKLIKLIKPYCGEVYGIDEERVINYCKLIYETNNFYAADIQKDEIELDKKFDLIISSDVIEHLIDPDKLISLIKKYSHEDTLIVISTPERDFLRGKDSLKPPNKSHIREWNKKEFTKYLQSRGLKVIYRNVIQTFRILFTPTNCHSIKKNFLEQIRKAKIYQNISQIKNTLLILCVNKRKQEIKIPKNDRFIDSINNFIKNYLLKIYLIVYYLIRFLKKYNKSRRK